MSAKAARIADAKPRCWSANSSGFSTGNSTIASSLSTVTNSGQFTDLLSSFASSFAESRVQTATVADAATRPAGISPGMMDSLIELASKTATKLASEAQASLQTPMKRKNVQLVSRMNGVELFESVRPQAPQEMPVSELRQADRRMSFSRSLWNRLKLKRTRSAPVPPTYDMPVYKPALLPPHVPRVFGLAQVHATMDELKDIIGHRSIHASSILHPGMDKSGLRHSLIDLVDEAACLRVMKMPPTDPTGEPRDFLIVEYHHAFKTPTGKNGYVVACHSVHWTGCPSPSEETVRGSIYRSGIVALESDNYPDRMDLYCAAEVNLKADVAEQQNFEVSRHRVVGTLARITLTIEERAKMLLSLDHTRVFQRARKAAAHEEVCSACKDRIGQLPPGLEPYVCRKCYMKVCGECSSIWQRGRKDMRLCMECWADATLNRDIDSRRQA